MKKIIALILFLLCALLCMQTALAEDAQVLKLPRDLLAIEDEAFYGATSIYKAVLPKDMEEIGSKAFANSTLKVINLPENLKNIAADAFDGCEGLTATVVAGSYAESYCIEHGIATAQQPSEELAGMAGKWNYIGVMEYGRFIDLSGSTGETAVEIYADGTADYYDYGGYCTKTVWKEKDGFVYLTVPHSGNSPMVLLSNGTMVLGSSLSGRVFLPEGGKLPTVSNLPESPTKDGFTFELLTNKTLAITGYEGSASEIVVPAEIGGIPVSKVDNAAFMSQDQLTSVKFSDGIEYIAREVFNSCYNLASVSIPDSVNSMGIHVFASCDSLSSVTLPDHLLDIQGTIFTHCSGLNEIKISANNPYYTIDNHSLIEVETNTLINYPANRADTSYTVPDYIEIIGQEAFSSAQNLTSVILPEGVVEFKDEAFRNTGLTTITLPASLVKMGGNPFPVCNDLHTIIVDEGNTAFYSQDGVLFEKEGNRLIYYPLGRTNTEYSVPAGTLEIAEQSFGWNGTLLKVILPEGLKKIDYYAFYYCRNMTEIVIPEGVNYIGPYAFCECYSLNNVVIPSTVTEIMGCTFSWCRDLTNITLPETITTIYGCSFENCKNLTSINLPASITLIEDDAFSGCPETLTAIVKAGSYAEEWCKDHNIKYTVA